MVAFELLLTVLARIRVRLRLARCRDFWFLLVLGVLMRRMVYSSQYILEDERPASALSFTRGRSLWKPPLRSQGFTGCSASPHTFSHLTFFPGTTLPQAIAGVTRFWTLVRLVTWLHTLEAQPLRHYLLLLLQWDLELVESSVHAPQLHRRWSRNITSKRRLIRTLVPAPPEQVISFVRQLLHLGDRHACHLHSLFLDLKLHIRLQTTNTRDRLLFLRHREHRVLYFSLQIIH
jgi:hypothetical protein